MSLTRQVKQELARIDDAPECCSSWELKALLLRHGYYTIRRGVQVLNITVDDNAVARKLFHLLRRAGVDSPLILRRQETRLRKNSYQVQVSGYDQVDALLIYLDLKEAGRHLGLPRRHGALPRRNCCRRAFLRGAFLAGGSISFSGRSGYHLEINSGGTDDAALAVKMLEHFHIGASVRTRRDQAYLYLKNAEAIADFLRIIGAGSALLQLESLRVIKSMRNRVNRLVNFETANLEKVIASAQQQLEVIASLERLVGLDNIPPSLREAARLRRAHPEVSLTELGGLLDPPVGKSGMHHRFRQMEKILEKAERRCGGAPGD